MTVFACGRLLCYTCRSPHKAKSWSSLRTLSETISMTGPVLTASHQHMSMQDASGWELWWPILSATWTLLPCHPNQSRSLQTGQPQLPASHPLVSMSARRQSSEQGSRASWLHSQGYRVQQGAHQLEVHVMKIGLHRVLKSLWVLLDQPHGLPKVTKLCAPTEHQNCSRQVVCRLVKHNQHRT